MTGTTKAQVEGLIDGAASPFYINSFSPVQFAWQNYVNSNVTSVKPDDAYLKIYVLQMPSAEQATSLYSAVLPLSEYARKKGTPDDWQPTSPTIGTEARIQDNTSAWWINFHQGVYYVEVLLDPSVGPAPDYTPGNQDTKKEALRFAQAVSARISGN